MTRAGASIGVDNLLAGSRLSLPAELDVHNPEPIVEDVLIETAALTGSADRSMQQRANGRRPAGRSAIGRPPEVSVERGEHSLSWKVPLTSRRRNCSSISGP
jgi:hypothetical protein